MKGKFLLSVFALLLPVSLYGQVAKPSAAAEPSVDFSRYEVFGGLAYSGANQVKGSSALIGFDLGADAKLKKWFGATADFGQYENSTGLAKPIVTSLLAGPEIYISSEQITGFFHVLFGGEHTGNIPGGKPDVSFAYGVGGGFDYAVSKRLAVRIAGDGIVSSFVLDPNHLGYSPHAHASARATAGLAYRF